MDLIDLDARLSAMKDEVREAIRTSPGGWLGGLGEVYERLASRRAAGRAMMSSDQYAASVAATSDVA